MHPAAVFAVNPDARVHIETLDNGCPILVMDGFYADPMAVRSRATQGRYDSSLAYYPGVHSAIVKEESEKLFETLAGVLNQLGFLAAKAAGFFSDFSLVTTPAKEMLAEQKHPHIDGVALAGVIYLNPSFEVGTSFFRHKPTGLSLIRTPEETSAYYEWLDQHGKDTQPTTYAVGDTSTWEHLYSVQGRFNRMVMYPGNAFHSIAMQDVANHLTIDSARLTQRLFLRAI